jgi:cyclic lactone autoinducer peptide
MRDVEKVTDGVLRVVAKIARSEVQRTMFGRISECSAIWHQPKRPKRKEN